MPGMHDASHIVPARLRTCWFVTNLRHLCAVCHILARSGPVQSFHDATRHVPDMRRPTTASPAAVPPLPAGAAAPGGAGRPAAAGRAQIHSTSLGAAPGRAPHPPLAAFPVLQSLAGHRRQPLAASDECPSGCERFLQAILPNGLRRGNVAKLGIQPNEPGFDRLRRVGRLQEHDHDLVGCAKPPLDVDVDVADFSGFSGCPARDSLAVLLACDDRRQSLRENILQLVRDLIQRLR
jgi:hypothetical protein